MLRKLSQRIKNEESGFTLIELLVVILIIGILAAIALPAFLGQQQKGQDASAKSDARNLVSQLESCYANEQNYNSCVPSAAGSVDGSPTGLSIGSGAGQVTTTGTATDGYTIVATSKSGNKFTITKQANGASVRTCTTGGQGSCPQGGSW